MTLLTVETKSEEKSLFNILVAQAKSKPAKKKAEDDDDDELDEEAPKKSGKASKDDDEDDEVPEKEDDWNKEEAEEWDPDFEEFDLPKSKGKKAAGTGTKPAEEEEDFKVEDEEFKDLFNDGAGFDEDEEEEF